MKLSKRTLLGLALVQVLTATAWGQVKNQSAYEKWKAEHPELVNSKPTTPVTPTTPSATTTTKPPKVIPTTDSSTPSSNQEVGPARRIKSEKENQALFSQYCVGNSSSAEIPTPNYQNAEVARAGRILSKVADTNFYFYADIRKIYEKGAGSPPSGYSKNAHIFLTQACGEFRDRAEMVAGKVRWVNNMIMLRDEEQNQVSYNGNIWSQLSGRSYMQYLQLSNMVFTYRAQLAAQKTDLRSKLHSDAQEPVPGFTVCETKFMIGEYVAKGKSFTSLDTYESELKTFAANCSQDDKDYYYNFRGDSNFKHYSPESNAMLWHAISIARFCSSPTKSNGQNPQITDQVCENYFKKPFLTRYKAAKSGLGAWLLYGTKEESTFGMPGAKVTVLPSFDDGVGYKPFRMLIDSEQVSISKLIGSSTLNFEETFAIGTSSAKLKTAFERLRNAVNRHTNWYASSYNDGLGHAKSVRDQAYSPFVASSYEMSMSNGFTECGITVQCEGDGRKAWMLVFKIHKNNWYTTRSLMNNQRIDFDRMWLDETSFGTDALADRERAWDRLGTALEHELDSILYLHNLEAGSGRPVANDSLGD